MREVIIEKGTQISEDSVTDLFWCISQLTERDSRENEELLSSDSFESHFYAKVDYVDQMSVS